MTRKLVNSLILSDEEYTHIEDLAACNYSPEKIALYLSVDKETFLHHWRNPDSPIRLAFNKGQLVADYEVIQKQLANAKSGNITAAQVFLKERENNKVENVRNLCFFSEPVGEKPES